ncbi:hypothetical protein Bca4012_027020 [Brassica carinata]|uniref:Uncharacterized protein n=1 Tax=Brassica carinata TaxID=52824 RepID=A0A8X7VJF7_BRACI|nr:hypothetical protein Bca52824_024027 [Brassica carinata]
MLFEISPKRSLQLKSGNPLLIRTLCSRHGAFLRRLSRYVKSFRCVRRFRTLGSVVNSMKWNHKNADLVVPSSGDDKKIYVCRKEMRKDWELFRLLEGQW